MTTLFTFIGLVVAAGLVLGGYYYFAASKTKSTAQPKLTTLDKDALQKLGSFFAGNTPTSGSEILTVAVSSLFQNRVGINNDLKVTGGTQISGPTALGDLTVDKTSTLGITHVRGQLTVAGPATLQSPVILANGASITGNLTSSGNGSFGGSLSAGLLNTHDLSVSGTFNLAGHIAITGQNPSVGPAHEAGAGATASIDGNDSAGTVTINTGSGTGAASPLVTITFRTPYAKIPRVLITPVGQSSGTLSVYVQKTDKSFSINAASNARPGTSYAFDYWVVQ
jgi:hypothetical protein